MMILKGCPISQGEFSTTTPSNSVLRGRGALDNILNLAARICSNSATRALERLESDVG